jgi:hypothetical protein
MVCDHNPDHGTPNKSGSFRKEGKNRSVEKAPFLSKLFRPSGSFAYGVGERFAHEATR